MLLWSPLFTINNPLENHPRRYGNLKIDLQWRISIVGSKTWQNVCENQPWIPFISVTSYGCCLIFGIKIILFRVIWTILVSLSQRLQFIIGLWSIDLCIGLFFMLITCKFVWLDNLYIYVNACMNYLLWIIYSECSYELYVWVIPYQIYNQNFD